jgi:hypothetical protein
VTPESTEDAPDDPEPADGDIEMNMPVISCTAQV